jgi:TrwC relaxase
MTLRKIQTVVGDHRAAKAVACYPLDPADAPRAFDREGEGGAQRANTIWLGSGEALAMFGVARGAAVDVDDLAAAMQGLHAKTGETVRCPGYVRKPGRTNAEEEDEEPGEAEEKTPVVNTYDLTFSAPKSVSVVWSQAGKALRARIEQAMLVAANAALEHVTGAGADREGGAGAGAPAARPRLPARRP